VYGGNFGYWTEMLMEVNFSIYLQILYVIYKFIVRQFHFIKGIFVVCFDFVSISDYIISKILFNVSE
jgi:hypothetical protein